MEQFVNVVRSIYRIMWLWATQCHKTTMTLGIVYTTHKHGNLGGLFLLGIRHYIQNRNDSEWYIQQNPNVRAHPGHPKRSHVSPTSGKRRTALQIRGGGACLGISPKIWMSYESNPSSMVHFLWLLRKAVPTFCVAFSIAIFVGPPEPPFFWVPQRSLGSPRSSPGWTPPCPTSPPRHWRDSPSHRRGFG